MVDQSHISIQRWLSSLLGFLLLTAPMALLAHPGHDHGAEFESDSPSMAAPSSQGIEVDGDTAQQLGLVVEPVRREFLELGMRATAEIEAEPDRQVSVNAPVNGALVELLVQPGDWVAQGQALAVVEAPELIDLRVRSQQEQTQREAEVRQAQASLTLAQRNYERQQQISQTEIEAAERHVQLTQERYDRDRELAEAGAIPRQQVLQSQSELAQAQHQLSRATGRQDLLEAEADLDRAQAALDAAQSQVLLSSSAYDSRLQQLNSPATAEGRVTVTAPITGTIAKRHVSQGQTVEEAVTPLLDIINGERLLVTADVHERDIGKISTGQGIRATVASEPGEIFQGWVTIIGSAVDRESRTLPVTAELIDRSDILRPGMFAELEILTDRSTERVLTVPSTAIVDANGQEIVFVQNGDRFEPVEVTTGERAGDRLEIRRGLFDGDQVVVQGALQLYAQSLRGGGTSDTHDHD
ncbi:MAG: efflux RND transporter periplasmic adaptor subunit, partial [Phormidium sp. BM_Day4_Bin.17]|nr:efflux RND transporter periplasmic adaptor subunit [Phormidium sp. BM_Day4_Bin.17]